LINQICRWDPTCSIEDGVIVGCSQNHEYLLQWWWGHYSTHNNHPVTFFDFGDMSSSARSWCSKRGGLIKLPSIEQHITPKHLINPKDISSWESHIDLDPWKARLEWFKKPFACLRSPYQRTIWFDLDCQIFQSVAPIFDLCEPNTLVISEEPPLIRFMHEQDGSLLSGQMEYNTGVIAFLHGVSIMEMWASKCLESNQKYRGDQEVLAHLAHELGIQFKVLPPRFNWRGDMTPNKGFMEFIAVIHWLGECKKVIRWQIDHSPDEREKK